MSRQSNTLQQHHNASERGGAKPALTAVALLSIFLIGCGGGDFDASLDAAFKRIFTPGQTPQQHMLLAVSSEDPDIRRDSVAKVAESKKYDREWAVKGFVAIALLETDPQTRCVAIRALARTGDPRATQAMLKILNYEDHPPKDVWPPVALVRWDATAALAGLSKRDLVPAEQRDAVLQTLLRRLRLDTDRHTRIAAARGLAHYPQMETLEALIAGLRDSDFAVAWECESSLVALTGHTFNGNSLAWENWLAEHRDSAFANAGHIPASRRPPYDNRWEKMSYDTKELIRFLWPGSKNQ